MDNINLNAHMAQEPVQFKPEPVQYTPETTEESEGYIVYKLKKPFDFEGQFYTELTLDLDSLTGQDIEDVFNELPSEARVGVIETNKGFLAAIAAKSAGVHKDFFRYCSAKDYSFITLTVTNFLLG